MAISLDSIKTLIKSPAEYLSPSHTLSLSSRFALQNIFDLINPHSKNTHFDKLLVDGFDAEQIWCQIDIQSQPLISNLKKKVKNFEKLDPNEFGNFFGLKEQINKKIISDGAQKETDGGEKIGPLKNELSDDEDDDDDDDDEDVEESEGEEGEEEKDVDEEGDESGGELEDKFLKMKEMEKYMKEDEKREYGLGKSDKKKKKKGKADKVDDEEEEDEDEDDGLGLFGLGMDDDEGEDELGNARYEDFFGSKKTNDQKRKPQLDDESEDSDMYGEENDEEDDGKAKKNDHKKNPELDDESEDSDDEEDDGKINDNQKHNLSTHEKEQQKLRAKIDQMEQANLDPKHWAMQGEVTAAKRPKNSALEVDLDFEHNVRPPPVVTEEFTADIEELIKKRIVEGKFDEVLRVSNLQSKAPKEKMEMDENKSKKGLADIYEDEFVQKTGLVSVVSSFSDEQKKEASMLFKRLCLKLDALSHFHFTPKQVVEDMSIQANVPALAMEEIAPLAVSDAAMLAPEEVYAGKGDIKEETELTQAERKRRRANKKRKYKAETVKITAMKKARQSTVNNQTDGKEE